jgi:hypothetical protein
VAAVDVDVVLEGHFLQRHRKPQCREATRRHAPTGWHRVIERAFDAAWTASK